MTRRENNLIYAASLGLAPVRYYKSNIILFKCHKLPNFTSNIINMKQITSRISDELYKAIEDEADKQDRSVSYIVSVLLSAALKERNRKKKNAKEDRT